MTITMRMQAAALLLVAIMTGAGGCRLTGTHERQTAGASARGRNLYQDHCIGCHGLNGTGDAFQSIPSLAGQRLEYLRLQIEAFASDKRHDAEMHWALERASMNVAAASDLATFLSALPQLKIADGDARRPAQGESSFHSRCASCHGQDARGNEDGSIPALRAQHDGYLIHRLRQLGAASAGLETSAHGLNEKEMVAVASYLSSLKGQGI